MEMRTRKGDSWMVYWSLKVMVSHSWFVRSSREGAKGLFRLLWQKMMAESGLEGASRPRLAGSGSWTPMSTRPAIRFSLHSIAIGGEESGGEKRTGEAAVAPVVEKAGECREIVVSTTIDLV